MRALPGTKITELDISRNNFGNLGLKSISRLIRSYKCLIEKLLLNDCGFDYQGTIPFYEAIKANRNIKYLVLD